MSLLLNHNNNLKFLYYTMHNPPEEWNSFGESNYFQNFKTEDIDAVSMFGNQLSKIN